MSFEKKIIRTQVCICGGGPAGFIAAIAASRCGCRTVMVEQYGFPGGMATAGLVGPISKFRFNGRRIIGGIPWEFVERLRESGGAITDLPSGNVPFDSERYKLTALEMLREAGVTSFFHSTACDPEFSRDGRLARLRLLTAGATTFLEADCFIDCSGVGILIAGRKDLCRQRSAPGTAQPLSLIFKLTGVDTDKLTLLMSEDGVKYANATLRPPLQEAEAAHVISCFGGPWTVWGSVMRPGCVSVNCTRSSGDITDPEEAGAMAVRMRLEIPRIIELFRRTNSCFRHAELLESAVASGYREGRELNGVHRISAGDLLGQCDVRDAIALGGHPMDRHLPESGGQAVSFLQRPYPISFRAMVPAADCSNLLAAGGLTSATPEAFSSLRVQAQCMALGEAIGTAAAHVAAGTPVQEIDGISLRKELESQNVITRFE